MIYRLSKEISFPDPRQCESEESGLLAIGGDLSTDRLLLAYSHGIFPWFPFRSDIIQWYCPMKRFVIFSNEVHISHSMRNFINKSEEKYYCTFNTDFDTTIRKCANTDNRIDNELAWLGEDIIKSYTTLNKLGIAKSVELRRISDHEIVGGFYGVCVGKCFCGESMFSEEPNTSKLALIAFASYLNEKLGTAIIDCQFETSHLKSMGGRYISYDEYMNYINYRIDN